MKPSKILLTLLSMVTMGLSSTALMADGEGDMDRTRMRLSDHWRDVELTPELEALVRQFRVNRVALMNQFRELQIIHREEMAGYWKALKDARVSGEEADVEEALATLKKAREEFRAEHGEDIRGVRHELRNLKRQVRERIREQRDIVDPET